MNPLQVSLPESCSQCLDYFTKDPLSIDSDTPAVPSLNNLDIISTIYENGEMAGGWSMDFFGASIDLASQKSVKTAPYAMEVG